MLFSSALLFVGCASKQVVVEGNFPSALIDPLPITLGVMYPTEFSQHEFFDEAKGRSESDWLVKTGEAQVAFWNLLLSGMFEKVVLLDNWDAIQSQGGLIDGVLIPAIAELQYTIPTHTNVKIYEIWMRYEFKLFSVNSILKQNDGSLAFRPGTHFAAWPITAYGKTPTAFLQTDEEAINLAAIVALRDAGAHFITTFGRTPEVVYWLDSLKTADDSPVNAGGTQSSDNFEPTDVPSKKQNAKILGSGEIDQEAEDLFITKLSMKNTAHISLDPAQ